MSFPYMAELSSNVFRLKLNGIISFHFIAPPEMLAVLLTKELPYTSYSQYVKSGQARYKLPPSPFNAELDSKIQSRISIM